MITKRTASRRAPDTGGGVYFDEGQIGWELIFDWATLGTHMGS